MTLPGGERKEKKVDKYARHFTCFQFGENVRSGALLAQSGLITTGKNIMLHFMPRTDLT